VQAKAARLHGRHTPAEPGSCGPGGGVLSELVPARSRAPPAPRAPQPLPRGAEVGRTLRPKEPGGCAAPSSAVTHCLPSAAILSRPLPPPSKASFGAAAADSSRPRRPVPRPLRTTLRSRSGSEAEGGRRGPAARGDEIFNGPLASGESADRGRAGSLQRLRAAGPAAGRALRRGRPARRRPRGAGSPPLPPSVISRPETSLVADERKRSLISQNFIKKVILPKEALLER